MTGQHEQTDMNPKYALYFAVALVIALIAGRIVAQSPLNRAPSGVAKTGTRSPLRRNGCRSNVPAAANSFFGMARHCAGLRLSGRESIMGRGGLLAYSDTAKTSSATGPLNRY